MKLDVPTASAEPDTAKRETGTIARTIMVLRAIADTQVEPTLKDLADAVNLPTSTMHRLLDLLAKEGMVERDDVAKTFRPGMEFFRLASHVVSRMPLSTTAKPFLTAAMEECNESSYLGIFDAKANKLMFAAYAESAQMLNYRVPLNVPASLVVGASGLAVLAWLSPAQIDSVIETESANAAIKVPPKKKLLSALAEIRHRGYAHTFGERIKGAVGFFAPVFDGSGRVCASFGFTIPEVRFDAGLSAKLIKSILVHGSELSRTLGYSGPYPRPEENYK